MNKKIISAITAVGISICAIAAGNTQAAENRNVIFKSSMDKTGTTAVDLTEEADKISSLHAPIINKETGKVTFSYIYFGSYPQSEVSGTALTTAVTEADYVSGEAVVDGIRYRRISREDARTFEEWKEYQIANHPMNDGKEEYEKSLDQKKNLFCDWDEEGTYRYFRYEPIKWRVLELKDGEASLIADRILDEIQYTTKTFNVNWYNSLIREWLNADDMNGFYGAAFSSAEKSAIYQSKYLECNVMTMSSSGLGLMVPVSEGTRMVMTDYTFARGGIKGAVAASLPAVNVLPVSLVLNSGFGNPVFVSIFNKC